MDTATQQLLSDYKTPKETIGRLQGIETLILTGISGAGKDTIIHALLKDSHYVRVVTSTTRAPRENNGVMEEDGVDYYFLSLDEAKQKLEAGEYIEAMNVHGRVNGSLVKEYERIAETGNVALTNIDYQGAAEFLTFGMKHLTVVFVIPPNFDIWFQRLSERYGGSLESEQEEVLNRMRSAQKEIAFARSDERFIPVMNDDIDRVTDEIKAIAESGIQLDKAQIKENHQIMDTLLADITTYLEEHS